MLATSSHHVAQESLPVVSTDEINLLVIETPVLDSDPLYLDPLRPATSSSPLDHGITENVDDLDA